MSLNNGELKLEFAEYQRPGKPGRGFSGIFAHRRDRGSGGRAGDCLWSLLDLTVHLKESAPIKILIHLGRCSSISPCI